MWWGIDGELKSKFGEWSEKFWKSSSWGRPSETKNFRAIYFANGEGSKGGGKSLNEMKGGDGTKLIEENNDTVKEFFNVCVGGQNGNGCKENDKKASVVLVGGDERFGSDLRETIESQWEWNGRDGSIVDGGRRYSKIFEGIQTKSGKPRNSGKFNWPTLNRYISTSREKKALLENLCPWIEKINERSGRECRDRNFRGIDVSNLRLPQFLNSTYAESYFGDGVWEQYQSSRNYLALLALLNLWSTDLAQMNFDRSGGIFETNQEKFKLGHLMNSNGRVIYLDADNGRSDLKAISYHSGGEWKVKFCPNNSGCSSEEGLNLTVGDGKFCVIDKVCFSESDSKHSISKGQAGWRRLMGSAAGLWSMVFGSSNKKISPYRTALISFIVACFKDVKNVSLIIKTSPTKEKLVAKH